MHPKCEHPKQIRVVHFSKKKSVVGGKIRLHYDALLITSEDALFYSLSPLFLYKAAFTVFLLFLWLQTIEESLQSALLSFLIKIHLLFKCHNPARCASHHLHPRKECGRPRPGNGRGFKRRRKRPRRVIMRSRVRWVKKVKRISRTNRVVSRC